MKSKTLDHLGLVAAMCEQIGLEEMIDTLIPPDSRAVLSTGETVKLMVINGLGFTSRPLYLWVYMVFEGIHVLYQNRSSPIVLNLSEPHDFILELLGERYWKKYQ